MSIVNPKTKTILLVVLAILDCTFAFSLVYTSVNTEKSDKAKLNTTGNMVILADMFDTEALSQQVVKAKEEKRIKEEEERKKAEEEKKKQEELKKQQEAQKKKEEEQKKKQQTKTTYTPVNLSSLDVNKVATQINKLLKSTMSGKGYLIASYSIQKGVDPYIAAAIILTETGCRWTCSNLVKKCNNVGGMVGKGCGRYQSFATLDIGIKKFIDNLAKNYFSIGLNTPEKMNSKYAESKTWASQVNDYVKKIKSA